jgi:predicted AlkP superfamily pyrophosphatase or phosphodiesterase
MPVKATDTVAGHGSPWDYDRRALILFWWPGLAPTSGGEAETVDIAPTLAGLLGVTLPPVDAKPLAIGR